MQQSNMKVQYIIDIILVFLNLSNILILPNKAF